MYWGSRYKQYLMEDEEVATAIRPVLEVNLEQEQQPVGAEKKGPIL